jgi:molybdopterin converting factor small subunit
MNETIPVRVLLFARYAELLGRHQIDVAVPPGATVRDAVAAVRALPGGAALPSRPFVARGLDQVTPDASLIAGDELAILPPMSGG